MRQLIAGKMAIAELRQVVDIQESGIQPYPWLQVMDIDLTELEQRQLQVLALQLENLKLHLLNEATIWSRAIYPLLLIAEHYPIQAWSQVPLSMTFPTFQIEGIADGVLANAIAGYVESPYLVVVEAKRGLEAQNPQFQLYGQMLAAAGMNWERDRQLCQEIFGCYTIADSWTFFRAEVSHFQAEKILMKIESSREYNERLEMAEILKILKRIVANKLPELQVLATS